MREMHCDEFVELVTGYLDGALTPEDHDRMVAHLELCDACSLYLDQFRVTVDTLSQLPSDPLDRQVKQALLTAFRSVGEKDSGSA